MQHIEVVAAIIINRSRILCMQRGESQYDYIAGKYEFPGGKIEAKESKVQALRREIQEEMGILLPITAADFFMTVNHSYPNFTITMHSYICHVNNPDFTRKEHIGHQWVLPEELDLLDWAAADLPIVKKLKESKIC